MRVRLFTLLVVPAAAAMILASLIVVERSVVHGAARTALQVAVLADEMAALDKALGEEALAAAELLEATDDTEQTQRVQRFLDTGAATDVELQTVEELLESEAYLPEIGAALAVVDATLAFRGDVTNGLVSALQILDRYSYIRGLVIDSLSSQALVLTTARSQQNLLALIDLIQARSAHLDERVAVELARRYGQWAPGLHSAAIASVTSQSERIDNANRFLIGDELEAPELLAAWRKEISISNDAPRIHPASWAFLSDAWIAQLEAKIDQQRTRTMNLLADKEAAANSDRWAALLGVGFAVFLAFLIASIVSVRLVRRVKIITDQAGSMAAGTATRQIYPEVRGADELGQLAQAFDEMAVQIETRIKNQWTESMVLESIVQGATIDAVMHRTAGLLGTDETGCPIYRFVSAGDGELAVELRNDSSGDAGTDRNGNGRQASLLPESDSAAVRTAIGLVKMARRRDDDNAKLAWQASRDELTGLLNRGAVIAEIQAMDSASTGGAEERAGLLYIDLDGFKAVNDQFGHAAGDEVLIAQSARLEQLAPGWDAVVGRLGGDEFLVALPSVGDQSRLQQIADRFVSELAEPIPSRRGSYQVGVTIGGVLARPGVSALKLLNEADAALYEAKKSGRGRALVSTQELRDRFAETEELRKQVIHGLEAGEFVSWFQPIWGEGGTTLVGMEALARWQHPQRGMVSPGVFIPVAQELNLLPALDRTIFEAVCRQVVAWTEAGYTMEFVHYNLSTAWLEQPDFVEETSRILAETGCPPESVVAEVTESGLMTNITANSDRLNELRSLGIRVAVDDFGQGYSSLAYLSDLPIDLIKIDRRFVDRIDEEDSNRAIVSAMVGLAGSFGLQIVAEGVERYEELDYLAETGCDFFQGFLLARPLPVAEATALLGRSRHPDIDRSSTSFPITVTTVNPELPPVGSVDSKGTAK